MCDGSPRIRMHFVQLTDSYHAGVSAFVSRNGVPYLRVDGACRYWAYGLGLSDALRSNDPSIPRIRTDLDPIITGQLSPAEAEELATAFQYLRWPDFDGLHSELPLVGQTPSVFTDAAHRFSCAIQCDAPGMPHSALGLRDTALEWILRLTDAGSPVGGAVRVAVFDTNTSQSEWEARGFRCLDWLLPLPPRSYAVGNPGEPLSGDVVGTLVQEEAEALRAMRAQFRADRLKVPPPTGVPAAENVALPVCDEDKLWSLHVSDVLEPYEQDGIVPE